MNREERVAEMINTPLRLYFEIPERTITYLTQKTEKIKQNIFAPRHHRPNKGNYRRWEE